MDSANLDENFEIFGRDEVSYENRIFTESEGRSKFRIFTESEGRSKLLRFADSRFLGETKSRTKIYKLYEFVSPDNLENREEVITSIGFFKN